MATGRWLSEGTDYGSRVLPIGDLAPHRPDDESCPCLPLVERFTSDYGKPVKVIIHNAFDGRHLAEQLDATAIP